MTSGSRACWTALSARLATTSSWAPRPTPPAGLAAACGQGPDCIVCDIDLPDSDGSAVARHVRTHPSRVSVTPFLFLSGLDDEASRLEGFHVGADVYITKPFRVDEV